MVNQTEKNHLPIWFKKLRLRKQILCLQLFSSSFILGILALCLYLLFQQAQGKISDIAEQILIEKILLRFSNRIVKYYEIRVLQGYQESSNQLTFMNQLYHFTLQNSVEFQSNVDEALLYNYTKFESQIVWNSQFSFGIFGYKIQFEEYDLLKLSNVLTQMQSLIPRKATLFFVGLRESQYFSAIPGNYFIDYIPKSRPWYENHLNNCQSETFPLSEPYLNYFGGIIITKTGNLTNIRNEIIGICGNDINMTSFWGLNNIENVEIYLIDENGRLILSPHYQLEQTEVDYIYDVNAIGFNKSDYLIITQQITQTNQVCQFQLESFFCLENKKNNQIYYINTYPIKIYRVIIRFQKEQYENPLTKFQDIKQKVQNYNTQFEYIILGVTLILFVIFQYLTSSMLQRPLERIMFCSKLVMTNNELPSMIRNLITKRRGDQIDKLSQAFQNLISLNRRRQSSKKLTEYFTQQNSFPRNSIYHQKITNYKKLLSKLDNQGKLQMQFTKSCLKFHNWKHIF